MNKVRTIIIDGIAIRTSLSAVEIANLPKVNAELKKENERLKEQYCERTDCGGRLGNSKKVEELIKENEKLNHYKLLYQKVKDRNDLGIERLEALIVFWKKYNPIDNTMQVEQFKGVIELLKGNNE